eukprot:7747536-Lingulodinium_polyedra.AAC.1
MQGIAGASPPGSKLRGAPPEGSEPAASSAWSSPCPCPPAVAGEAGQTTPASTASSHSSEGSRSCQGSPKLLSSSETMSDAAAK